MFLLQTVQGVLGNQEIHSRSRKFVLCRLQQQKQQGLLQVQREDWN